MIWSNINHCPKKLSASGHHGHHHNESHSNSNSQPNTSTKFDSMPFTSLTSIPEENHHHQNNHLQNGGVGVGAPSEISEHCKNLVDHDNEYKSNIVVHADCHAASRGLFAGLILMILTIVFIILLHVASNEP